MHSKISSEDYAAIGSTAALARARAIAAGQAWSLPGYANTPIGRRVEVTGKPVRKMPVGPMRTYDETSLTQRIATATKRAGVPAAEREADRLAGRKSRVV